MAPKAQIWKYFIKTDSGGKCKICDKDIKTKNNTTNLHNHVKSMHDINANVFDDVKGVVPSKLLLSVANTSESATNDTNNNIEEDQNICTQEPAIVKKIQQPRITAVMSSVKSFQEGRGKAEQITNFIVFMIIKDCLPFRTVEKIGFKSLMKVLCPLYKIPCRETIKNLIDLKYDAITTRIKNKFANLNAISLTCDVWTETTNTQSYMGVTSHYIYNGVLESTIIGVKDLHESHDAKYLGKILEDMCNEWSISNIVAWLSDNAANITKAIKDTVTKSGQLPCMAHTLNLVVSESLEKIVNLKLLLDNVKEIVTYFKRCVNAAEDLKKETGDSFEKPTRLVQSVITRWNSTFYMLQRFLLLKTEIAAVLLKSSKAPTMLGGGDIEILQEVSKILEPFEIVTRDICGEKYETCGKIIPTVYNLIDDLNELDCQSVVARNLKLELTSNIEKRCKDIESNQITAIAMVLDPRFKISYFKSALATSTALSTLNKKLKSIKADTELQEIIDVCHDENTKTTGIWKHHKKRIAKSRKSIEQNDIGYHFELKQYLKESEIPFNENPLLYWNKRKTFWPSLHRIAEECLTIPATSVPSERLFSVANNIMTKRRNRIKPGKLQKILFLHCLSPDQWN